MRLIRLAAPLLLFAALTAAAQQHPNIERGLQPDKSYQLADVDTINLFNGTVNVAIPLGLRYPVGGNLSYQFSTAYATNTWEVGTHYVTEYLQQEPYEIRHVYTWMYPALQNNAGLGWLLTFGMIRGPFGASDPIGAYHYVSPDGGAHGFAETLHDNNPAETPWTGTSPIRVGYTRDGTYLRLRQFSDRFELDFPDGNVHGFDTTGRLIWMKDRYNNSMSVAYGVQSSTHPHPGKPMWTVSDSVGRVHYVYFRLAAPPEPGSYDQWPDRHVVHSLDLAAFNGGRAQYFFDYQTDGAGPTPSVLVSRRCPHSEPQVSEVVRTDVLSRIRLPHDLQYEMTYDLGSQVYCSDANFSASGNLQTLRLTTGAEIRYEYGSFLYPSTDEFIPPPLGGDPIETTIYSTVPGLTRRTVVHNGAVLAETEYVPVQHDPAFPEEAQKRIVREKNGGTIVSEVHNYFSTCVVGACSNRREYGLPFSRIDPSGGAFLSTQTYTPDANGSLTLKRSTAVLYEGDGNLNAGAAYTYGYQLNRRLRYSKTVFEEDGTYSEETLSDFDGLGHYRTTTSGGTVGGTDPARSGNNQTVTNYNPSRGLFIVAADGTLSGGFTMVPVTSPWILGTYDVQQVTENGQTATAAACFDANGFLTSRRTYAEPGANPTLQQKDLLAIFTPDSAGNLIREQFLGGDDNNWAPAPTGSTCLSASSVESYRIDHQYDYGVRARTFFRDATGVPLPHYLLDVDIDASSGLVKSRREASRVSFGGATLGDGLKTNLFYDSLGRLIEESPDTTANRGAKRRIAFSQSSTRVDLYEDNPSTGATLRTRTLELDGLGRVLKETRSIPSGATASRTWEYDDAGRVTALSAWGNQAPVLTHFEYDGLGRMTRQIAPDGSVTTFGYTGVRQSTVASSIRTSTGDTVATTTSEYDRQGRLRRLTDPAGLITRYKYDVAGRLVEVCADEASNCVQKREFTYDNRGFLLTEKMPELGAAGNGTTTYAYDARGNVIRKTVGSALGAFDTKTEYDRAGRPKRVYEAKTTGGVNRDLKLFEYGTVNSGTNYKNGRLTRATRYNWVEAFNFNIQIFEDYVYSGREGRVSSRTTLDSECAGDTATCNTPFAGDEKRSFTQTFAYDELGAMTTIGQPSCTHALCQSAGIPDRIVTNGYDKGWLTSVTWTGAPKAASISYHDNGMVSRVDHANDVADQILLNSARIPRPHMFTTTNVVDPATCAVPTFSTQPLSQTIASGSTAVLTAKAEGQTGSVPTYQWYRGTAPDKSTPLGAGTLLSGNVTQLTTSTLTTTTSYWVEASNSCASGQTASQTATVTVCSTPSITTQPAGGSITRSQSFDLSVVAAGSSLTYQWYLAGGSPSIISGATAATLRVTPVETTSYLVRITNACGSVDSATVTVTVYAPPTIPGNVTAGSSGTTATIVWTAASSAVGIASYQIERQDGVRISGIQLLAGTNSGLTANKAYLYRVRAFDNNGVAGSWSPYDLTTTTDFTDDPLPPVTQVKTKVDGSHISQLRRAIDGVRSRAGLAPGWSSYADPTGVIYAGHIAEMRALLNEARTRLWLDPVEFTDPLPSPEKILIRADHIRQLRGGVK